MRSNIDRTASGSRSPMSSDPLPDRRDPLPNADTHGRQAEFDLAMGHLSHQRANQARPAAAERMAQRDRSPVDVDPLLIEAEQPYAGERLGRESLVQLDDADVGRLEACLVERLQRGGYRPDSHV